MKLICRLMVFSLFFHSCLSTNQQNTPIVEGYYDIVDDPDNGMSLWFEIRGDSVFVFYCNVLDDGNYLNCSDDSTDHAGAFNIKDLRNSSVRLKIKSYRFDDSYLVNLLFKPESAKIFWKVDSGNVSYLPEKAEFVSRNSKKSVALMGNWQMEQDKSISVRFSKDSVYTYEANELIYSEKYVVVNEKNKEPLLLTISGADTNYQTIMGVSDSILTLLTSSQGKVQTYHKKNRGK